MSNCKQKPYYIIFPCFSLWIATNSWFVHKWSSGKFSKSWSIRTRKFDISNQKLDLSLFLFSRIKTRPILTRKSKVPDNQHQLFPKKTSMLHMWFIFWPIVQHSPIEAKIALRTYIVDNQNSLLALEIRFCSLRGLKPLFSSKAENVFAFSFYWIFNR